MMKNVPKLLLIFLYLSISAQVKNILEVSDKMFATLNFPSKVESIKISFPDIISSEVKDDNIFLQFLMSNIKVKGNMLVKTIDGNYYSFIVEYKENPSTLNYFFDSSEVLEANYHSRSRNSRENKSSNSQKNIYDEISQRIVNMKGYIKNRNVVISKKMSLIFKGIYCDDTKMYFLFHIGNLSKIPYDIESYKFEIVNNENKSTAIQSQTIIPINIYNEMNNIKPKSDNVLVFTFEKFTIDESKDFAFSLIEKGGDRNLTYFIKANHILNANQLNIYNEK